jgi:phage FluMu gp28-like protein
MESGFEFALDDVISDYPLKPRDPDRHLYVGVDIGRHRDRTVITVVERSGNLFTVRAILRLDQMSLPDQQERLEKLLKNPAVRLVKMDATGLGVGLFEYVHRKFPDRIHGLNFASTIQLGQHGAQNLGYSAQNSGLRTPSVRVPEFLATQLLQAYEDHAIHQPIDNILRDDLRKPERLVSPSGRVSIAATRDSAGHADHFWSLALAIDAAQTPIQPKFEWHAFMPKCRLRTTTL